MLTGIDYFIVVAYLIGILLLGVYFRRFVHSSTDFFLGGRMLPFWAIGMSIVVSDIGATDFIGVAGQAYRYGISVGNFDWIGSVPAMLLAAFVFIPCFWKSRLYTIPEYLGRRYNDGVRTIASLTWIVFFAFSLGNIFFASAKLLDELMGWPYWVSIITTATVVGLYTFYGGLTAVIMTDVVQMIIMFVGGGAVVFLGFYHVGGWSGLVEQVSAMGQAYDEHFDLILPVDTKTPYPWTGILFGLTFVMSMAYMIGNQKIVQRCFSAKNEWHAKASMIFAAFLKMLIPILVLFPGLIAIVLHPQLDDGDKALPALIRTLLPPGLRGLMFAAFIAGLMSSIDSLLNSTATLWTKDIYEKFIRKGDSDQHYLIVGRIATIAILVLGVMTSPINARYKGIYVAIQTFLSIFQGPIFSVLLLGIFWKGTTQWGGLAGLVGGMMSSGLMYWFKDSLFTIEDPFVYVSWWSFVAGSVITVVVSLLTKEHPIDRLYGLVYRLNRPEPEGAG
ncbi:MAG: sodium:solute symporter family transporter [Planctomycetota bacterium]